jgi:hypothetical protein
MSHTIFADVGHNISLTNGMVRIEFATTSAVDRDAEGRPIIERQCCIVLTPKAFLQTFGMMNDFVGKLKEAGVIFDSREERREGPARKEEPLVVGETRPAGGKGRKKAAD